MRVHKETIKFQMCSLTSQINLQNWHQISSVKYMFMTNLFDLRINGYNI